MQKVPDKQISPREGGEIPEAIVENLRDEFVNSEEFKTIATEWLCAIWNNGANWKDATSSAMDKADRLFQDKLDNTSP